MDCLFCGIVAGRVPAARVWETDDLLVFADHQPIRRGHVQIVPKVHYEVFDDLPPPLAAAIVHLGQRIARAQKRLYGVDRVGFVFTGNDVAHVHAHVLPLHAKTDITSAQFFLPPLRRARLPVRPPDALSTVAEELCTEISAAP